MLSLELHKLLVISLRSTLFRYSKTIVFPWSKAWYYANSDINRSNNYEFCSKGVGSNSIQCTSCQKWLHKKCSGIKGGMSKVAKSFICRGCLNPVTSAGRTSVDIGASAKLKSVDKFCYLGDMLSVDGDADAAVEARIRIGWNKFSQFGATAYQ